MPLIVRAQQFDPELIPENNNLFSLVGLSLNAGAHAMDLRELNKSLNALGIPKLEHEAGAVEWQLHLGNEVFMGNMFLTLLEVNQSQTYSEIASKYNYVHLSGVYAGGDLSRVLLNKRKWQIYFPSLGAHYSNFQLSFDSVSKASANSINNLTLGASSLITLKSIQNINVKAGAEFYYKTGWFKKHVYDIKFGLKTGYILPISNNPWQQENSNIIIPDLPVIDKGSYYLMFQIIGVMLELADRNN
ncbi:hypothetical protein I5M27_05015 [Adhaeribacter sp. BT258]|uniref:DUF5723 domain-containing protein n=1 Tax=Adhaeribacter terrigena TaxID=2793070 RepID=A0ABS1C146_9BACT|nr:hypothetical protein [Adhaeribacter terrigena]MBK0402333.1 hypothetical protein [Adhaeribacter terrigena]